MLAAAKVIADLAGYIARLVVLLVLGAYRVALSPVLGPACRFYPSCSAYAMEAVNRHGVLRGVRLAAGRLVRCNPFCPGGYDPVGPRTAGSGSAERVPAGGPSG